MKWCLWWKGCYGFRGIHNDESMETRCLIKLTHRLLIVWKMCVWVGGGSWWALECGSSQSTLALCAAGQKRERRVVGRRGISANTNSRGSLLMAGSHVYGATAMIRSREKLCADAIFWWEAVLKVQLCTSAPADGSLCLALSEKHRWSSRVETQFKSVIKLEHRPDGFPSCPGDILSEIKYFSAEG